MVVLSIAAILPPLLCLGGHRARSQHFLIAKVEAFCHSLSDRFWKYLSPYLPSGNLWHSYGSHGYWNGGFSHGNMVIFHSYVKLPDPKIEQKHISLDSSGHFTMLHIGEVKDHQLLRWNTAIEPEGCESTSVSGLVVMHSAPNSG